MSTPGNTDTPSFADQVNNIVSQATVDDSGNLQLPEGVEADESVMYAAKLEKQRRDTQSSFTRLSQENKRLQAEADKLTQNWEQDALKNLTIEDRAEMEELKAQDPEEWRNKMNQLEQDQKAKFAERRAGVTKEAQQLTELELREQQLNAFNEANPDFQITDDVIDNDIPPRLTKSLESGDLTFEEFLEKAKKYISTPKKIQGQEAPNEPNIGKVPGSHKPSDEAREKQINADYSNEIF